MKLIPLSHALLGVGLALASSGCAHKTTAATFRGSPTPVLLGPVDRVGIPGGEPLAITELAEFETEANYTFTQGSNSSDMGSYVVTTNWERTEETGPLKLAYDAYVATQNATDQDIRLTSVKPVAYGVMCGMKMTQFVEIEGRVVKVEGAK